MTLSSGDIGESVGEAELDRRERGRVLELRALARQDDDIERPETAYQALPQCYQEIKTLLWIESSVIHKKALDEWERKLTLLTARVERKRKQSLHQRNEIYNLVGFFSVFQGVLLTAVSQSNLLHCNNWWSPFLLSTLASIVTFVGVLQKFWFIFDLDNTIYSEEKSLKAAAKRVNALRGMGKDFRFADVEETKKKGKLSRITVYPTLVFTALVAFAVVFAVSHPIILCHPGCVPDNSCSPRAPAPSGR